MHYSEIQWASVVAQDDELSADGKAVEEGPRIRK